MTKHGESTLNWPPTCPKDGAHLNPGRTLRPRRCGSLPRQASRPQLRPYL